MIFGHFLLDNNEANAYIVGCEKTHEALLVDAGAFDPAIAEFLAGRDLKLTKVFITHDHFDHTDGLDALVSKYGPEILAGRERVAGHRARKVGHGNEITVGDLTGRVLSTEGHTGDSLSLAFQGVVFTGDALFAGSIGGTSTPEVECRNIRDHLFTLPGWWALYPGHGPASTVAIESQSNPFFV